jgi:hypothetical protein
VNRSRCPTHCIAATMNAIVKPMKLGRTSHAEIARGVSSSGTRATSEFRYLGDSAGG